MDKLKFLHLARKTIDERIWTGLFREKMEALGELTLIENTAEWDEEKVAGVCREHDVVITHWGGRELPEQLADAPGRLRYICNISGTIRPFVPRRLVEAGITVTNWGDHPAMWVAEGALALMLSVLKQIAPQSRKIQEGGWVLEKPEWNGSVHKLRLGVYGMGVIGRTFVDLVKPLQPQLFGFDPYLETWPDGIERMDSLDSLFEEVDAVVIAAALTDETKGSVQAHHLAKLPDGGVFVNIARGAIVDQKALFAELEAGRLRAGLDVLDTDGKDFLDTWDPARSWPNLTLTAHRISNSGWNRGLHEVHKMSHQQTVAFDNLTRFAIGEPLKFTFDLVRYDRST